MTIRIAVLAALAGGLLLGGCMSAPRPAPNPRPVDVKVYQPPKAPPPPFVQIVK